jgi:hypothetical protein
LQSIVDWGARNGATRFYVSAIALYGGISLRLANARGYANAQIEAKRAQRERGAAASLSRGVSSLRAISPTAVVTCKTILISDEG